MPQMSPLPWVPLMISTMLILSLFWTITYTLSLPPSPTHELTHTFHKKSWKW